jgi:hypothetical protein
MSCVGGVPAYPVLLQQQWRGAGGTSALRSRKALPGPAIAPAAQRALPGVPRCQLPLLFKRLP